MAPSWTLHVCQKGKHSALTGVHPHLSEGQYIFTVVCEDMDHGTCPTGRLQICLKVSLCSFICQLASSNVCVWLGQAPLGVRRQLLRAGFVAKCEHTAGLLWALLRSCHGNPLLFKGHVYGYWMLSRVNKQTFPACFLAVRKTASWQEMNTCNILLPGS